MQIQRLFWAGIRLSYQGTTIVIDPLFHVNEEFFGKPHEKVYPLEEYGPVDAVLITHLHSDHFDHQAIADTYGADTPVYVPLEALKSAQKSGLTNLYGVACYQSLTIGDFKVIAAPSVDGLGDPQTAWIVEGGEHRIIHCGDTLWHGYWWNIGRKYGPFDVAFLPANAAIIEEEGLIPSHQPLCLSPDQAVSASAILGAKLLIPIHYGAFRNPPKYRETIDVRTRLYSSAQKRGVPLRLMPVLDELKLT